MNPDCPDCKHPYSGHTADGCWHHDAGAICECRVIPPAVQQAGRTKDDWRRHCTLLTNENDRLNDMNQVLAKRVEQLEQQLPRALPELLEKLRLVTERAERLDKENDERFTRETEYQNRIRALEQRLRDVASYAARDLPQR